MNHFIIISTHIGACKVNNCHIPMFVGVYIHGDFHGVYKDSWRGCIFL